MSRLPHFLDTRLREGSEVVSLKSRLALSSGRFLVLISVDPRAGRVRSTELSGFISLYLGVLSISSTAGNRKQKSCTLLYVHTLDTNTACFKIHLYTHM
jgi:hypothetical protein